MRSFWLSVVVFAGVLLLAGLHVEGGATAKSTAKADAAGQKNEPKTVTVHGYGEDAKGAQANALREAQDWLERELRGEMKAGWSVPRETLDPKYLAERGVINFAEAKEPVRINFKDVREPDENAPGAWRQSYEVTLKPEYVTAVRSEARKAWVKHEKDERQVRAESRQQLLLRVLGGAAAVLLVVAVYMRLEEATRGYYTSLLRAGAFVLLALAALALVIVG